MPADCVRFFAGGIKHFAPMLTTFRPGQYDLVKTRADSPQLGFFLPEKSSCSPTRWLGAFGLVARRVGKKHHLADGVVSILAGFCPSSRCSRSAARRRCRRGGRSVSSCGVPRWSQWYQASASSGGALGLWIHSDPRRCKRPRRSAGPAGGSVVGVGLGPRARSCRVRRCSARCAQCCRRRPGPGCFPTRGCHRPSRRG